MNFFLVFIILLCFGIPRPSSSSTASNQTRIINGQVSKQANWPFIAAIYYGGNELCGGTIWNEDTLVTAAHCLFKKGELRDASKYEIILGHEDLSNWDQVDSNYVFGARRLIAHSKYKSHYKYDIAIIKLDRRIDFTGVNQRARCVCNPVPIEQVNASACMIMGWGRTEARGFKTSAQLQEVTVPLLSDDYCAEQHTEGFNPHWNFCAGYKEGGKDSCTGDSGGPLVCPLLEDQSKWSLVGVVSFGKSCAEANSPGYYTKVINFVHWINVKAGEA